MFDFMAASEEPVDLRVYLKKDDDALSETWLFQHLQSAMYAAGRIPGG